MKKNALLLLACLAWNAQAVLAQSWCPSGAAWCFGFDYGQSNGYYRYTYTGDTVAGGITEQVIAVEGHYYQQDPPGYHDFNDNEIHTRTDNGIVYIQWLASWDTLIWYSAVPGNRWQILQPDDSGCNCWYNVTDTGHTVIDGLSLRYVQTMITGECTSEPTTRRFLERIGSVHGTFPGECGFGAADTTLRNYQDGGMSYSPSGSPPCDFINGINDQIRGQQTMLFPNPGTGSVTIQGSRQFTTAEFLDRTGRICLTVEMHSGNATGDVSALSPGVYIVRLRGQFGTTNGVFVKH